MRHRTAVRSNMRKQLAVGIFLFLNLLAVASMREASTAPNCVVSGDGIPTPSLPVLPQK